jgi:hypothetical protein
MATRKKLEPTFEPGRSYVVKGDLLNQIARQLRDQTPHAGPGILLKEVSGGVLIQADTSLKTQFAWKIHSGFSAGGQLVMGVGPFGALYDTPADGGDLVEVEVDGRLDDPDDMGDAGWFAAAGGDYLILLCNVADGDITTASIAKVSGAPTLIEFSSYTQTLFRVPLAKVETIDGKEVVVPLHEGELVTFFEIARAKLAKYAR